MATPSAGVHTADNEPVGATPTDAHAKSMLHHSLCREIILSFPFDVDDGFRFFYNSISTDDCKLIMEDSQPHRDSDDDDWRAVAALLRRGCCSGVPRHHAAGLSWIHCCPRVTLGHGSA